MFKKEEEQLDDINKEIGEAMDHDVNIAVPVDPEFPAHDIVDPHAEMEHHEAIEEFEKKRSKHHGHAFELVKHILIVAIIAVILFLGVQYGSKFYSEFTASTTTTTIATTTSVVSTSSTSTSSTTTTTIRLDIISIYNATTEGEMFFYIEIDKFNIKELPTALNYGVYNIPYKDVCLEGEAIYDKIKLRFKGDDRSSVFYSLEDDYCKTGEIFVEVI